MATRRSLSVSVSPPNSQTRWWGGSSAAKTILTAGSLYSNRLTPSGAAAVPPATAAFCLAPPEPPQATPKTRTKVARARERLAPRIGAGGDEEGLAGRSGGAHAASSVSRPGGQARPWRHRPVPLKSSASCRSSVEVSIVGRRTSGKQVYSCGHRAAANERVAPGRDDPARGGIPPIGSATPALSRSGERPLPNLVRITLVPERRQVIGRPLVVSSAAPRMRRLLKWNRKPSAAACVPWRG